MASCLSCLGVQKRVAASCPSCLGVQHIRATTVLGHGVYKLHSHILLTAIVLRPSVRELPRCTLLISASCGLDHRHHSAVSSDLENSFRFLLHLDIRCCHICFTGALRSSQSPCVYHRSLINSARASSLNHKWSSHGGGIIDVALILHCVNAQN